MRTGISAFFFNPALNRRRTFGTIADVPRLAYLLVGINLAVLIFAIGFAPEMGTCHWPTGDEIAHYTNCRDTKHLLPTLLGTLVLTVSYYLYRRPEGKPTTTGTANPL